MEQSVRAVEGDPDIKFKSAFIICSKLHLYGCGHLQMKFYMPQVFSRVELVYLYIKMLNIVGNSWHCI